MIPYKYDESRLLNGRQCSDIMIVAILLTLVHECKPYIDNHWLKVEYRMDISAVADPPVAMRMRLDAMIRFRSLHRTAILVAQASPLPSSIRPRSRPNCVNVGG